MKKKIYTVIGKRNIIVTIVAGDEKEAEGVFKLINPDLEIISIDDTGQAVDLDKGKITK